MTSTKSNLTEEEIDKIEKYSRELKIKILKAKRNIKQEISLEELLDSSFTLDQIEDISLLMDNSAKSRKFIFSKLNDLFKKDESFLTKALSSNSHVVVGIANEIIFIQELLRMGFSRTSEEEYLNNKIPSKDRISLTLIPRQNKIKKDIPNLVIKTSEDNYFKDSCGLLKDLIESFEAKVEEWSHAQKINLEELLDFNQKFEFWESITSYKKRSVFFPNTTNFIKTFKGNNPPTIVKEIEDSLIFIYYSKNLEDAIRANPNYLPLFLTSKKEAIREAALKLRNEIVVSKSDNEDSKEILSNLKNLDNRYRDKKLTIEEYAEELTIILQKVEGLDQKILESYVRKIETAFKMTKLSVEKFQPEEFLNIVNEIRQDIQTIKDIANLSLELAKELYLLETTYVRALSIPDVVLANTLLLLKEATYNTEKLLVYAAKKRNIEYLNKLFFPENINCIKSKVNQERISI